MCDRVNRPFLFEERTITGNHYLDVLGCYAFPQIEQTEVEIVIQAIWQQDGARPLF